MRKLDYISYNGKTMLEDMPFVSPAQTISRMILGSHVGWFILKNKSSMSPVLGTLRTSIHATENP